LHGGHAPEPGRYTSDSVEGRVVEEKQLAVLGSADVYFDALQPRCERCLDARQAVL